MPENQSEIPPFLKPSAHTDFVRKYSLGRIPDPVWEKYRGEDREWLISFCIGYLELAVAPVFQHFKIVLEDDLFVSSEFFILLNDKTRPKRVSLISKAVDALFTKINWKQLHPDSILPDLKRLDSVLASQFSDETLIDSPPPVFLKPYEMTATALDFWEENLIRLAQTYYSLVLSWTRQPSFHWEITIIPVEVNALLYRRQMAVQSTDLKVFDREWEEWVEKVVLVHDWFSLHVDCDGLNPGKVG
ncbi:MAG: hypothetical protein LCH54_00605 [Bacteroidetes bacterium]|nr:hypothetical protein [Bacteroidota bacterium]